MFNIWQSVKVNAAGHPREGQAGTVQAINPKNPDVVGVRFDSDGVTESVAVADLLALSAS